MLSCCRLVKELVEVAIRITPRSGPFKTLLKRISAVLVFYADSISQNKAMPQMGMIFANTHWRHFTHTNVHLKTCSRLIDKNYWIRCLIVTFSGKFNCIVCFNCCACLLTKIIGFIASSVGLGENSEFAISYLDACTHM